MNLALASDGYFHARCGYKYDACVAKATKIIEEDCPERCPYCYRKNSNPRLEHWFSKGYLFPEFRMKYFKNIEILYEIFFIISKYCPISNSNVKTVITDMNNIEQSSDSDSSNEVYNINNINNRNNIVNNNRNSDSENRIINISNSENYNIVTSNLGNSSIGDENRGNLSNFLNNECVNIYVTWYRLYNFLLGGMDADIIDLNYKKKEWISK